MVRRPRRRRSVSVAARAIRSTATIGVVDVAGRQDVHLTATATSGLYGPAINADSVGNWFVGGPGPATLSARFTADRTGSISSGRTWWKNAVGYGGGTGGTMEMTIQTDNNGVPSGTVLGTSSLYYPGTIEEQAADPYGRRFGLISFPTPAPVTAGTVYHFVYSNVDADPAANYASINNLNMWSGNSQSPPRQPKFDVHWALMLKQYSYSSWVVYGNYTPILDLGFVGGGHWGQGYMNTSRAYGADHAIVGTTSMVRERFTVTGGDRTVSTVRVRLAKTSGSGDLLARLEDASGNLIDSASISTADVPTIVGTDSSEAGVWVSGAFSTPRTLVNSTEYRLRLSTDASTSLWTRPLQKGGGYGFDASTYFSDGVAEVTTNSGSTWGNTVLGASGDLQFYFTT